METIQREMENIQREMETKEKDILSSLPEDVLSSIISYLPPKEAVRTSILSRRWSHRWWGSITSLSIDLDMMNCGDIPAIPDKWIENMNKWMDIIDKILRCCQGSIRDCQIECRQLRHVVPNDERWPLIGDVMERLVFSYERWAEILTRGGIERLVFRGNGRDKVPSSILNCDSMRFLQLRHCQLEPKFSFDGCRYLKVLTLVSINLSGHPIHHAISRCVHLEKLHLAHCYGIEDLTIPAQNLKYLYIWLGSDDKVTIDIDGPNLAAMILQTEGEVKRFCVRAPNLRYSNVNLSRTDATISERISSMAVGNSMNIFELFILSNVINILALRGNSMEVLAANNLSRCLPTPFNMLRILTFQVNLKYQRQAYVVMVLLKRCPYLQELHVALHGMDTHYSEEPYPEYSDVDEPFCCLDACLEEVGLSNFMGFDCEVEFAKFIIANARVLKRITIIGNDLCDDLKAALESMQKASSCACINYKDRHLETSRFELRNHGLRSKRILM